MFSYVNVGGKIKGLAKVIFIISAIITGMLGLVMLVFAARFENPLAIFAVLILAGLGILMAWISSWMLYGYGEIITKLTDIERNTSGASDGANGHDPAGRYGDERLKRLREEGLITEEEYKRLSNRTQSNDAEGAQGSYRNERLEKLLAQGLITEEEYRNLLSKAQNGEEAF